MLHHPTNHDPDMLRHLTHHAMSSYQPFFIILATLSCHPCRVIVPTVTYNPTTILYHFIRLASQYVPHLIVFVHPNTSFVALKVWLSLFQLLMTEDCQRKYELNSYRKSQILKVTTAKNNSFSTVLPTGDFIRSPRNTVDSTETSDFGLCDTTY